MDARRGQIRDLLRAARARLEPAAVGLRPASRRKVPGLRREDVAALAQVSLKWYSWLEQGRDLNFSEDLIRRVAHVLRLSTCEQAYLLALTQRRESPPLTTAPTEWLWRTVQHAPVPMIAMTLRWDVIAWNDLTSRVFRDYGAIPFGERNLLRIFLTDEQYQRDAVAYEQIASRLLAEFRIDFGHCARDGTFDAFIRELHAKVPLFERLWNSVHLGNSPRGTVVQHAELGDLYFDRLSYIPEHSPATRILTFIPGEPHTARVIAALRPATDEVTTPWNAGAVRESYVLRHH